MALYEVEYLNMSKGLGKIEKKILVDLTQQGETTAESLRWSCFEATEGYESGMDLSDSMSASFRSALRSLKEKNLVIVGERALQNFDECVQHYPGKTLRGKVRTLRMALLPSLRQWVNARYSLADNEAYHAHELTEEEKLWLSDRWHRLEPGIRSEFNESSNNDLLLLIAQARFRFTGQGCDTKQSLGDLIGKSSILLRSEQVQSLESLYARFLPLEARNLLALKSLIYQFVEPPGKNRGSMKHALKLRDDTIQYLHKSEQTRNFIISLPGYKPGGEPFIRSWLAPKTTFDESMHDLFDLKVFEQFNFVRLA
jgi:hypothetical protein